MVLYLTLRSNEGTRRQIWLPHRSPFLLLLLSLDLHRSRYLQLRVLAPVKLSGRYGYHGCDGLIVLSQRLLDNGRSCCDCGFMILDDIGCRSLRILYWKAYWLNGDICHETLHCVTLLMVVLHIVECTEYIGRGDGLE